MELLLASLNRSFAALTPAPINPLTKALCKSSSPSVIVLLTRSFVAPCTKPLTTLSGAKPKLFDSVPPGFKPPVTALAMVDAGSISPVVTN